MFDINPQTQFSHLREMESRLTQPQLRTPRKPAPSATRLISIAAVLVVAAGLANGFFA